MNVDRPPACKYCRGQRKKCDRNPTGCSQCKLKNIPCIYKPNQRKKRQRREAESDVEQLNQKLVAWSGQENVTAMQPDSSNSISYGKISAPSTASDPLASTTNSGVTMGLGLVTSTSPWDVDIPFDSSTLQSWLEFDLFELGGAMELSPTASMWAPDQGTGHTAPFFFAAQQSYNEQLIFAGLPSRAKCTTLLQILEARTKSSPFTSPSNYVDLEACKVTIETLIQCRDSSTSLATVPLTSISEVFRALAALACAYIKRPLRTSSSKNQPEIEPEEGQETKLSSHPLRSEERHETSLLVKATLMSMNAARASHHDLDLARLQGRRMLTLVLSWWGDLKEASNVVWLGFRYAVSLGLHQKICLLSAAHIATELLDVFWHLFIYASIFQILTGRELPIDENAIDINLPSVVEDSCVRSRIQAQTMASSIADKYYRGISGLSLPSETNSLLPDPLPLISADDQRTFERSSLKLDQTENDLRETTSKLGAAPLKLTLQGNVQSMILFFRYIRILINYPFSLQLPEEKKRVEEATRTSILSIWTQSKGITETSNRPAIIAGVCLRTMIFAAKFQADSPVQEVEQWGTYLSLGLDALEKLCSNKK